MSYIDKLHKKPVEYKITDNDIKPAVDKGASDDVHENFAVHDVPMSYFKENEDGKLSMKLETQSRIAPGGTHEFIIDPSKVNIVADKDRRSVDLYFDNMAEDKSATVMVDGRPRNMSPSAYVQDLRALVYKNRVADNDSKKSRGREFDTNIFDRSVDADDGYGM